MIKIHHKMFKVNIKFEHKILSNHSIFIYSAAVWATFFYQHLFYIGKL